MRFHFNTKIFFVLSSCLLIKVLHASNSPTNKVPNFEEYVALASKRNWNPTNPVEKLMASCIQYSQVYGFTQNSKEAADIMLKIHQEFEFVLSVLVKSKHMTFDLTDHFFALIDGAYNNLVALTKLYLSQNPKKVINFAYIEHYNQKMLYPLIQSLSAHISPSSEASHIKIDLFRSHAKGNLTALEVAVSKRLQRIYYPLLALGLPYRKGEDTSTKELTPRFSELALASLLRSVRIALNNGDDASFSLLTSASSSINASAHIVFSSTDLHLPPDGNEPHANMPSFDVFNRNSQALFHNIKSLGYTSLAESLRVYLDPSVTKNDVAPGKPVNAFCPVVAPDEVQVSQHQVSLKCQLRDSLSAESSLSDICITGPHSIAMLKAHASSHTHAVGNFENNVLLSEDKREFRAGLQKCRIDVIDSSVLDSSTFINHYVAIKKPVIIQGLLTEAQELGKWRMDDVLKHHSKINVDVQVIPYGDKFGDTQTSQFSDSQSLKGIKPIGRYARSMRSYTKKLLSWLKESFDDSSMTEFPLNEFGSFPNSSSTGNHFLNDLGLPYYVFDNKVLDSSSSISDILLNPFGDQMSDRKASSTTTRDIVGDGNSRDKSSDHKLSLLETIIQSTYVYLHSGNANIRDVNQTKYAELIGMQDLFKYTKQFYLGPPMSGAPFHLHAEAFNSLIYGRKLWLLLPPGRDLYSNIPSAEWLQSIAKGDIASVFPYGLENSRGGQDLPCYVEQREGEVIFVPSLWSHLVLNLAESIGFATEIH